MRQCAVSQWAQYLTQSKGELCSSRKVTDIWDHICYLSCHTCAGSAIAMCPRVPVASWIGRGADEHAAKHGEPSARKEVDTVGPNP